MLDLRSLAARITARIRLLIAVLVVFSSLTALFYITQGVSLVDPQALIVMICFQLAAEGLRALRLLALADMPLNPYSYLRAVAARMAGNAVSAVTPTSVGGELVKGYLLRGGVKGVIAGLYDSVSDLWANTIIALALVALGWRNTGYTVLTCLGLASTATWLAAFYYSPKLIEKLAGRELAEAIASSQPTLAKTILSIVLGVLGFLVTGTGLDYVLGLGFTRAMAVIGFGLLAGLIPTPGGLLAVDAVMTSIGGVDAALIWRLSWLATTVPGLLEAIRLLHTLQHSGQ